MLATVALIAILVPFIGVTTANTVGTTNATRSCPVLHPSTGNGTITFSQTAIISGPTKTKIGNLTITTVKETLDFTGNLTGTALTMMREISLSFTHDGTTVTFATFQGWGNFTGTLNSASVTLYIGYSGVSNNTYTRGNFAVKGETNANSTVLGEGQFKGPGSVGEGQTATVNYTIHFQTFAHYKHYPEAFDRDRHLDRDRNLF
jgi:hypothetical protein